MEEKIIEVLQDFDEELIIDMDRDLLVNDILDSFGIVRLVMALEDALDIEIDVDEVEAENFQTANAIIAMVKKVMENSQA